MNPEIQGLDAVSKPFTDRQQEETSSSNLFKTFSQKGQAHLMEPTNKSELKHWKDFFQPNELNTDELIGGVPASKPIPTYGLQLPIDDDPPLVNTTSPLSKYASMRCIQVHNTYILATAESGFLLVHQQLAHERILYDMYSAASHGTQMITQQSLFPVTLELSAPDAALLQDLLPSIQVIGYAIEPFGNNTFIIQGVPADILKGNEKNSIELLLEQFKHFNSDVKFSNREKLVRCMARQQSIKAGQSLTEHEMQTLIEKLFACTTPNVTPTGSPTYVAYTENQIDRMFQRLM